MNQRKRALKPATAEVAARAISRLALTRAALEACEIQQRAALTTSMNPVLDLAQLTRSVFDVTPTRSNEAQLFFDGYLGALAKQERVPVSLTGVRTQLQAGMYKDPAEFWKALSAVWLNAYALFENPASAHRGKCAAVLVAAHALEKQATGDFMRQRAVYKEQTEALRGELKKHAAAARAAEVEAFSWT